MHRSIFLPVVLFTFGLILSLGSSLALAEKAHDDVFETEINEETEMEAEDIDREDLRNFIQASNKVQDIRKEYTEEIQKDGDVSELRREAVEKMEENRIRERQTEEAHSVEEEEMIAVISAAVAAALNRSTHDIVVRSIRRIPSHAPSWNRVGRMWIVLQVRSMSPKAACSMVFTSHRL